MRARYRFDFFSQIAKTGIKDARMETVLSAVKDLLADMFTVDELKKLSTVSKKCNILLAPILEKISKDAKPDRLLLRLAKNIKH